MPLYFRTPPTLKCLESCNFDVEGALYSSPTKLSSKHVEVPVFPHELRRRLLFLYAVMQTSQEVDASGIITVFIRFGARRLDCYAATQKLLTALWSQWLCRCGPSGCAGVVPVAVQAWSDALQIPKRLGEFGHCRMCQRLFHVKIPLV